MVRETENFYLRAVNRDIGQPDQDSEMYPEAVEDGRRPYRKVDLPPVR
jgi:hypothetical protein